MGVTKFFIYGSGTWREVDTQSGSVSGWGKAQFAYVRHGRLVIANRQSVLKGLRALEAGYPTTVRDGPQLSQIRHEKKQVEALPKHEDTNRTHCFSCQHHCVSNRLYNHDALFDSLLKPNTSSVGTQYVLTADSSTQVAFTHKTSRASKQVELNEKSRETIKTRTTRINERIYKKNKIPKNELLISEEEILLLRGFIERDDTNYLNMDLEHFDSNDYNKIKVLYKINPLVAMSRSKRIAQMLRAPSTTSSVSLKDFVTALGLQSADEVSKRPVYKMRARKSKELGQNKENMSITISDNANKNQRSIKSDLESRETIGKCRNDKNENKIDANSKTDQISRILKSSKVNNGRVKTSEIRSVSQSSDENNLKVTPTRSKKGDITNITNNASDNSKSKTKFSLINREKINTVTSTSKGCRVINKVDPRSTNVNKENNDNEKKRRKGVTRNDAMQTSKRSNGTREYSRSEDESIVSWICEDGRERLVNGNRLWKELEPIHRTKTGHRRPWQSLRNRYLRYILPALGSLTLPPSAAQRLRAAAAAGELKSKNGPARRNSIFTTARLHSAWSRRPRSPLRTPGPTSTPASAPAAVNRPSSKANPSGSASKSTTTRSRSALVSPILPTPTKKSTRETTPTYSELTRRFALRHRSTPQSDNTTTSTDTGKKRIQPSRTSTLPAHNSDTATSRPRPSKRTRSETPQSDGTSTSSGSVQLSKRSRVSTSTTDSTSSEDPVIRRQTRQSKPSPEPPRTRRLYNPQRL